MTENKNPLLEGMNVIPGETFPLPSGGLFYTDGELNEKVENGEVHIYPMKTVDELTMKSPDKIFSGKAIEEVFSRCIPDIEKPGELLANDVEYLMAAIRVVSYGEEVSVSVIHPCKDLSEDERKEHSYIINVRDILRKARNIDPTSLDKKYKLKLDGYVISIRPPRYKGIVSLYQTLSDQFMKEATEEQVAKKLIENLADMIESVNGHDDSEHIVEWLSNIKAGWINKISTFTQETSNWGIEYTQEVQCRDCNEKFEITVPTNPITFFT